LVTELPENCKSQRFHWTTAFRHHCSDILQPVNRIQPTASSVASTVNSIACAFMPKKSRENANKTGSVKRNGVYNVSSTGILLLSKWSTLRTYDQYHKNDIRGML